jgi:hypothetical protein
MTAETEESWAKNDDVVVRAAACLHRRLARQTGDALIVSGTAGATAVCAALLKEPSSDAKPSDAKPPGLRLLVHPNESVREVVGALLADRSVIGWLLALRPQRDPLEELSARVHAVDPAAERPVVCVSQSHLVEPGVLDWLREIAPACSLCVLADGTLYAAEDVERLIVGEAGASCGNLEHYRLSLPPTKADARSRARAILGEEAREEVRGDDWALEQVGSSPADLIALALAAPAGGAGRGEPEASGGEAGAATAADEPREVKSGGGAWSGAAERLVRARRRALETALQLPTNLGDEAKAAELPVGEAELLTVWLWAWLGEATGCEPTLTMELPGGAYRRAGTGAELGDVLGRATQRLEEQAVGVLDDALEQFDKLLSVRVLLLDFAPADGTGADDDCDDATRTRPDDWRTLVVVPPLTASAFRELHASPAASAAMEARVRAAAHREDLLRLWRERDELDGHAAGYLAWEAASAATLAQLAAPAGGDANDDDPADASTPEQRADALRTKQTLVALERAEKRLWLELRCTTLLKRAAALGVAPLLPEGHLCDALTCGAPIVPSNQAVSYGGAPSGPGRRIYQPDRARLSSASGRR